jgi:hypothetical protein
MPAAHQRSAICPSRQRLTLRACSRQIEIMLSIVISSSALGWLFDVRGCVGDVSSTHLRTVASSTVSKAQSLLN